MYSSDPSYSLTTATNLGLTQPPIFFDMIDVCLSLTAPSPPRVETLYVVVSLLVLLHRTPTSPMC